MGCSASSFRFQGPMLRYRLVVADSPSHDSSFSPQHQHQHESQYPPQSDSSPNHPKKSKSNNKLGKSSGWKFDIKSGCYGKQSWRGKTKFGSGNQKRTVKWEGKRGESKSSKCSGGESEQVEEVWNEKDIEAALTTSVSSRHNSKKEKRRRKKGRTPPVEIEVKIPILPPPTYFPLSHHPSQSSRLRNSRRISNKPQKHSLTTPPDSPSLGSRINLTRPEIRVEIPTPPPSSPEVQSWESLDALPGLIHELGKAIKCYKSLLKRTRDQTVADLTGIIDSLPERPSVEKQKMQRLRREVDLAFGEVAVLYNTQFSPARKQLPRLWEQFLGLSGVEKREMAEGLEKGSVLTEMFELLGWVRMGIERMGRVEREVGGLVRGEFEEVLGGLKGVEEGREGGMYRENGRERGMEGGNAAMQWRVLEIVSKRREGELEDVRIWVGKERMGVSKGLLGVVEEVGEGGSCW